MAKNYRVLNYHCDLELRRIKESISGIKDDSAKKLQHYRDYEFERD